MAKPLVVRDAAHDYITFKAHEAELVRVLLRCREVQRLRRIKQLGFSYVTYPGAEHTRFEHSLGSAFVASCLCGRLHEIGLELDVEYVLAMVAAALLHDIGHLPFSHSTESALGERGGAQKHEEKSIAIVLRDTDVQSALCEFDAALPARVARLISGASPDPQERILHAFMDGNFDVDRLDFVIRDSVHTGVRSGMVDFHRLVTGFTLHESVPLFERKNLATLEEFLIARHMMYEKVYFHKTTRGMEVVYGALLDRLGDLFDSGELPDRIAEHRLCELLAGNGLIDEDFLLFDDADIINLFKATVSASGDEIAADLAARLLWRRPLKAVADGTDVPADPKAHRATMEYLEGAGFNPNYYFHWDSPADLPYEYTVSSEEGEGKPAIQILVDGSPQEISAYSPIARALMEPRKHVRVYAPEECAAEVAKLLGV